MSYPSIEQCVEWFRKVGSRNPDLTILHGASKKDIAWNHPVPKEEAEGIDLEAIVEELEGIFELLPPGKYTARARQNYRSQNGEMFFKFEKPGAVAPGINGPAQRQTPAALGMVPLDQVEKMVSSAVKEERQRAKIERLEELLTDIQAERSSPAKKDKYFAIFSDAIAGHLASIMAPRAAAVNGLETDVVEEQIEPGEDIDDDYNERLTAALEALVEAIPEEAPVLLQKLGNIDPAKLRKLAELPEAKIQQLTNFL